MKKNILTALLMVMAVLFIPDNVNAEKTVNGTVYSYIIKKGNIVYCSPDDVNLYKVNLKTKKAKRLVVDKVWYGDHKFGMVLKGDWLYYEEWGVTCCDFWRVNVKSGKKQKLADSSDIMIDDEIYEDVDFQKFIIHGSEIYGSNKGVGEPEINFSMSLDGKNKKQTNISIRKTVKRSNTKGYSVKSKKIKATEEGHRITVKNYLKTPKGKIYLGKVKYHVD